LLDKRGAAPTRSRCRHCSSTVFLEGLRSHRGSLARLPRSLAADFPLSGRGCRQESPCYFFGFLRKTAWRSCHVGLLEAVSVFCWVHGFSGVYGFGACSCSRCCYEDMRPLRALWLYAEPLRALTHRRTGGGVHFASANPFLIWAATSCVPLDVF